MAKLITNNILMCKVQVSVAEQAEFSLTWSQTTDRCSCDDIDMGLVCTDLEGGRGGGTGSPDSLKNHKNIRFLSNTGLDPLTNNKATI